MTSPSRPGTGSPLDRITQSLGAVEVPGAFATSTTTSSAGLRIAVKEVGRLAWPLRRTDAQRLIAVARPARYGLRDQTKLDPRVRDTWEIPANRVTVEEKSWRQTIGPVLTQVSRDLGLPDGVRLRATLHNLLVYQPGQFFRAHQDSEKADDVIGTLVVILPSTFTGGALVVEHDHQKRVFRGTAGMLTFIGFYADCYHRVQPVKTGYRVALTYNLTLEGRGRAAMPGRAPDALVKAVDRYFRSPKRAGFGGLPEADVPDRLVYLLDHQYTRRTLGWSRLKRTDAARAAALWKVAGRLDCEIALALADVHEQWSSEDEEFGYRGLWGGHHEWGLDEDEDDSAEHDVDRVRPPGDEPRLGDLLDSDIELRHWLDADGRPMKSEGLMSMTEVCATRESAELPPFASEHEGYMGNWGNTVDRWYHRAAVVLWPRSRNFVIRAKMAPAWAVGELLTIAARRGGREEARQKARTLVPFWPGVAWQEKSASFVERLLELAAVLDDGPLAASLLRPLAVESLSPKTAALLPRLIDRYGLEWTTRAAGRWADDHRIAQQSARRAWLARLPAVCRPVAGSSSDGASFARWLVRGQWKRLSAELRAAAAITPPATALDMLTRLVPACLGVVEASRVVHDDELHREVVAFLTPGDTAYPVEAGVQLLRAAQREGGGTASARFGLQALHSRCTSILAERMQTPVREPDDWSITAPVRCRCTLCRTLGEFLAAETRIHFGWPLAKDARRHVHNVIDAHALPVTHATRRTGRPFTLVLRKTEALFSREAARRRRWQQDLAWLRRIRGNGGVTGARRPRRSFDETAGSRQP